MRKTRKGEVVCRCEAYAFPHRFTSGACSGRHLADEHFFGSSCRDCTYLADVENIRSCQVIDGAEKVHECPVWREEVRKNEVRLYGRKYEFIRGLL